MASRVKDYSYIKRSDISVLKATIDGKVMNVDPKTILSGTYVAGKVKPTASKLRVAKTDPASVREKLLKKYKDFAEEEYNKDFEKYITVEDIKKFVECGLTEEMIMAFYGGIECVMEIKADNEFAYNPIGGVFTYRTDEDGKYVKNWVERGIFNCENNVYELGFKYPQFNWSFLKRTDNTEVISTEPYDYFGKKRVDRVKLEKFVVNAKFTLIACKSAGYSEDGVFSKYSDELLNAGAPLELNGGYLALVSRNAKELFALAKRLLNQPSPEAYVKDFDWLVQSKTSGATELKEANYKFAKGGEIPFDISGEVYVTFKDGSEETIYASGDRRFASSEEEAEERWINTLLEDEDIEEVDGSVTATKVSTYAKGGGVGFKERCERDSIKLAKLYQKVLDSNFDDKEYSDYQKIVKETQIPKEELQKIEHYITTTPKGNRRMIDTYRYWGVEYAKGGKAGEDLENYSNYDEFYNVVFDYIKREENLTEEETKNICIVNESIIEAEFDGGSSPRFTGDVVLGYLSNERGYMSKGGGVDEFDAIKNAPITYTLYQGEKVFLTTKSFNKAVDTRTLEKFKGNFLTLEMKDSKNNVRTIKFSKGGGIEDDYMSFARTNARESIDWNEEVRNYAGDNYDSLTEEEKQSIIAEMKADWDFHHSFAKGGALSEAKYIPREEIVKVELKNGKVIENSWNSPIYSGLRVGKGITEREEMEAQGQTSLFKRGGTMPKYAKYVSQREIAKVYIGDEDEPKVISGRDLIGGVWYDNEKTEKLIATARKQGLIK